MSSHKSTFRSRQESEKLKVNNNPLKFTVLEEPGQSRIPLPIEDIINVSLKDKREQKEALADLELSARLQTSQSESIY